MAFHRLLQWVGEPVRYFVRRQRNRFLHATDNCRDAQEIVFRRLMRLNADTRFADEHGLSPRTTFSEFRARVPVSDYDYHHPYIEEVKAGNTAALLGVTNRLRMFSLTSGTTSACKFIPVTDQFLADYRRGWQTWGITAFEQYPDLHKRRIAQFTGNHEQFRTPAGTPCGNISGLVTAMQKPQVRLLYTIPAVVSRIEDPQARCYAFLRVALADRDVGQVVTANPSTLLQSARFADSHSTKLIRDLHDGTLSAAFEIPSDIRRCLRRKLRPRPQRARTLERCRESAGCLRPADVWPHLSLLGVWTGGSAGTFVRSLRKWYGDVTCRDHGLHASEGRMTIPLRRDDPAGVLDIMSHLFEFIPEEEAASDQPTVLQPHEVKVDHNYLILLTTSSGLYRYNIRDVVRCTGFLNATPEFVFLHKGAHVSSVTGEKISESQVIGAVARAAAELGIPVARYTLTPEWGNPPAYWLYLDNAAHSAETLATRTDHYLRQANSEYSDKRASGRVGRIHAQQLSDEQWEQVRATRLARAGCTPEQYKHPCLLPDPQFEQRFRTDARLDLRRVG